jgi:hypothetical protein
MLHVVVNTPPSKRKDLPPALKGGAGGTEEAINAIVLK